MDNAAGANVVAKEPVVDNGVFVSIQINSNRPDQIRAFLTSVEETAARPSAVEVLVHFDTGDDAMERTLAEEASRRRLRVRPVSTDLVKDFFDLWKPLNVLLPLTASSAYFVLNCSDECRFLTAAWDDILRKYVGYYDDHIFRIRASRLRFRNYLDIWECGFAPDSVAFYTRRWLEIVGDWNPCLGPDSFQQCVAFHLYTADPFNINQLNRDIPEPFLRFSGEGASLGLEGEALMQRVHGHVREWFVLMSHRMQTEARRRAMLLACHIWKAQREDAEIAIEDDVGHHRIIAHDTRLKRQREWSYRVSRSRLAWRNNTRKLRYHIYAGGGSEAAYQTWAEGIAFYLGYKWKVFRRLGDLVRSRPGFVRLSWHLGGRRLNATRCVRRQIDAVAPLLKDVAYYIYGTGEYARRLVRYIDRESLPRPIALIEDESILERRGRPQQWDTIPIVRDREILGTLGRDDYIIIGSLVYEQEVVHRLKARRCAAALVGHDGW